MKLNVSNFGSWLQRYPLCIVMLIFLYGFQAVTGATAYHLMWRLFYVFFVGIYLWKRSKKNELVKIQCGECITQEIDVEYSEFKKNASFVMNADAFSFMMMVFLSRNTDAMKAAPWSLYADAVVMMVIGVGIKLWAASVLGSKGYYWYDFFKPIPSEGCRRGPYRFMDNPMYSVGYLHAYGFALLFCSMTGLMVAAFDHAAILIFHFIVEKPHARRLYG